MSSLNGSVVGILHPGVMGSAIAAQARRNSRDVLWCPIGRSAKTRSRADSAGLTSVESLAELVAKSGIIISLCPPAFASDVADSVAEESFRGLYVEANALAPERTKDVTNRLEKVGATVVDACVIGSPPTSERQTELYVSGPAPGVAAVMGLFGHTNVTVRSLGAEVGRASALKMAFSAYQKAARTLAGVAHALAREHGVESDLGRIAQQHRTNYLADVGYVPKVAARAWRWAPEMGEVGAALRAVGLPSELADATASVMNRWAGAKDQNFSVDEALALLGQAPETKKGPADTAGPHVG